MTLLDLFAPRRPAPSAPSVTDEQLAGELPDESDHPVPAGDWDEGLPDDDLYPPITRPSDVARYITATFTSTTDDLRLPDDPRRRSVAVLVDPASTVGVRVCRLDDVNGLQYAYYPPGFSISIETRDGMKIFPDSTPGAAGIRVSVVVETWEASSAADPTSRAIGRAATMLARLADALGVR